MCIGYMTLFVVIDRHLFNKLRGLVKLSASSKQKTAVSA